MSALRESLPEGARMQPPPDERSLLRRIEDWVFGYDFFISYRWECGGEYAVDLHRQLGARGFECFLDRSEFAAGDNWEREARRALRKTEYLIVVATRTALQLSQPVQKELQNFDHGERHIIPIAFRVLFRDAERQQIPALARIPANHLVIVEPSPEPASAVSEEVLARIAGSFTVLRRRRLRKRVTITVILALVALLLLAAVLGIFARGEYQEERRQRSLAEIERSRASAEASINEAQLLFTTQGSQVEKALAAAVRGYDYARAAGISACDAKAAVAYAKGGAPRQLTCEAWLAAERILAVTAEPLGQPWHALDGTALDIAASGRDLIVVSREPGDQGPYAIVATVDLAAGTWTTKRRFDVATNGRLALGSDELRWLATTKRPSQNNTVDFCR